MRRILLVLVLAAAALVLPSAPHASACSCGTFDVRESLAKVDGAFVGTFLSREDPQPVNGLVSSATSVRYRYRVEQAVKGDIPPDTIDVWAAASGASCGMETPVGQRAGLLLRREGDRWTSSLCSQVDPDRLIRAAQPLPPPPGKAPPAVVVGTTHGLGRMLSLDGLGRVVAYGGGDGNVTDIAFCPDGATLAESFTTASAQSAAWFGVALRSADDLTVLWERPLTPDATPAHYLSAVDVACPARNAGEVLALLLEQSYTTSEVRYDARVVAYPRDGDPEVLWRGAGGGGLFSPDGRTAWVYGGADGRDLVRIDLNDRRDPDVRTVVRLPEGATQPSVAPDGRHLAGLAVPSWNGSGPQPTPKVFVVDLAASPVTIADTALGTPSGSYTSAVWAGADRIVVAPGWSKEEPVRLFDTALRGVGSWSGWAASHVAVVGDHLVGLMGPKVITARVSAGPVSEWADLETGVPGTVVAFPGGAPIGRSRPETEVVAMPEHRGGGGTGGRPILAGGAGAALLAVGAAGLIRRRRVPKLPPL